MLVQQRPFFQSGNSSKKSQTCYVQKMSPETSLSFCSAKKKVDYTSIENSGYPKPITEIMKRLSGYKVEHGVVVTKNGRILLETVGDKEKPYNGIGQEKFEEVTDKHRGFIFLHNHPGFDKVGQPLPVTPIDAFSIAVRGGSEVVAVHRDATFSSIKFQPEKNYPLGDIADGLKWLWYDLNIKRKISDYNTSGKLRDDLWLQYAKKLHVIYANTFNFK